MLNIMPVHDLNLRLKEELDYSSQPSRQYGSFSLVERLKNRVSAIYQLYRTAALRF